MASSGANPADVFEIRKIRRLVELMNEHELSEIDLRQGAQRIRLRKGHDPVVMAGGVPPLAPQTPPALPIPVTPEQKSPSVPAPPTEDNASYITSPMIGTFYTAPNPDAAPFLKVGDRVGPESVVCVVEAMKVFNEIHAECSGMIAAVLAESGAPVEFGQKLFKIVQEA